MKTYTEKELKEMKLEDAVVDIGNVVYAASGLFERLEGHGKVRGNGHHIAQQVAMFAQNLMRERWES